MPEDTSARLVFLREIASGPMSVGWAAQRRVGGVVRAVTVKILRHRRAGDAEALFRMRDAARRLSALGHRNVVAAEDVARVDGWLALVAPYVEGVDLLDWAEVLRERGIAMPGRVVCEIARSIAMALDAAAYRPTIGAEVPLGMLHRDLKPTNVVIDLDGGVRVLDFGTGFTSLAGVGARAGALQKGLAKYLSPQRRDGAPGGPDDDVYALGVIVVELFRGRWLRRTHGHNPAHDRYLAEVVARLGDTGTRGPADDAALRSLLLRMVAYDPEARPTAAEVAHAFRTLGDRAPGPSLEAFAIAEARPLVAPLPAGPVRVPPFADAVVLTSPADAPPLSRDDDGAPSRAPAAWEETDSGWRPVEDTDEEEDTTGLLTPPSAVRRPPAEPPSAVRRSPSASETTADAPAAAVPPQEPSAVRPLPSAPGPTGPAANAAVVPLIVLPGGAFAVLATVALVLAAWLWLG